MHNGQVSGFDAIRRDADLMIPNALYPFHKGAMDSEVPILIALAVGLDKDPAAGALAQIEARSRARGRTHG